MVSGNFFSFLMMLCYCVLHVLRYSVHWNCCTEEMRSLLDLLEVEGRLARNRRFHLFNSWNLKDASHEIVVFISSPLGIWRTPRTKSSFSSLQLLEFEGRLARKLRFHLFTSRNLKEASHESFVFISSPLGIWRTPRTKASFSSLHLSEFEGSPARKLRFHLFKSWNLKEASHESLRSVQLNVCRSQWNGCVKVAFCGSMVILLRFAAESRKSHCNGSVRRVNGALAANFWIWHW